MTQKHKWYTEIIAFAEGRQIQERKLDSGDNPRTAWAISDNPQFGNRYFEFKVKPTIEMFGLIHDDLSGQLLYDTLEDAAEDRDTDIDLRACDIIRIFKDDTGALNVEIVGRGEGC